MLQQRAMLASVSVKRWSTNVHDAKVSKEVDIAHNASNAGRYTKALVDKVNRSDIWRAAAKTIGQSGPAGDSRGIERFFDGKVFDPANPGAYLASQPIKKLV